MIGIFGGSGFYDFTSDMKSKIISTPFGEVNAQIGIFDGTDVLFIPRHGTNHSIPPSQINYRANVFAAHKLKVQAVFATNAVGSLKETLSPGTFMTPDGILDFTSGRDYSFFDGSDFSITTYKGKILKGVVHVDVSNVYDSMLREVLLKGANKLGANIINGGTMVVTNGPRFESPAEIKAYGLLGGDIVGMTSSPEAFLFKELEIPYATLAVVTNYGAGLQKSVTPEEVFAMFKTKIEEVKSILKHTFGLMS